MNESKVEVRGLSVGYGPVRVVQGLDLTLTAASITAVLGPNGAGKSTTCQALAGLLPAMSGTVIFDGHDITRRPCWWRARRGVYLVPEGRGIFPGLTVEDNLRLVLPRSSDRTSVYERFPVLDERRRQHAGSLSGGEQQMLSLAPMLVQSPELLIVDEPTLGLAPRVVEQILRIFTELRDAGTTLLLVGESPHGLVDVAEQVVLLHVGRIAWSGRAAELDQATLEAAYFGAAMDAET
jgi:ABC-type branched-subunit amino acid transport system ATPase component